MKNRIIRRVGQIAMVALAGFVINGCMTKDENSGDVTTDGGNIVVTQETNGMGAVLNSSESASAKTSAADADTIIDVVTKEKILVPLHYDAACQCFVRKALFTSSVGFERARIDSIWLDSSGHLLNAFRPRHADSITHVRHVTRINNNSGREVDLIFKATLTRNSIADGVVFHWMGSITGTFNGTEFKGSSFDITFSYTTSAGFQVSGNLDLHRGDYEVVIVFGNGEATCTVTHKGKLVRHTHIDNDGKETE